MSFKIDATKESDDYFADKVVSQIPSDESQEPLNILLHEEEEYIKHGREMVEIYQPSKDTT